jgi:hypothetical protein
MSYLFVGGFIVGSIIPQMASNYKFWVLYHGIYRPHKDFRKKRNYLFKNDVALHSNDYYFYLFDIFYSFGKMWYLLLYGERKDFLKIKQQNCFKLIEEFEFVNETIENYENVIKGMQQFYKSNLENIPGTYENFSKIEKEISMNNIQKSAEEMNLANLNKIKEMSKDDYEKYLIDNAVKSRVEHTLAQSDEQFIQNAFNKTNQAIAYEKSIRQWKDKVQFKNEINTQLSENQRIDEEKNISSNVVSFKKLLEDKTKEKDNKKEKEELHKGNQFRTLSNLKNVFERKNEN